MTIYHFLETGDRRTAIWKQISAQYESLCVKDGNRFMETEEAKLFANSEFKPRY